jgi:hypothetical protein
MKKQAFLAHIKESQRWPFRRLKQRSFSKNRSLGQRRHFGLFVTRHCLVLSLLLGMPSANAVQQAACSSETATRHFRQGYAAQQAGHSAAALERYADCLDADDACIVCNYEIGWSYWSQGHWAKTVSAWKRTLELDPEHQKVQTWLILALQNSETAKLRDSGTLRVPIGTDSKPAQAPVRLRLVARFQNYAVNPESSNDHYDTDIHSPKSIRFTTTGNKAYVNSLEGFRTVVYDPSSLKKIGTIKHHFAKAQEDLFNGQTSVFNYLFHHHPASGNVNHFNGKPVESELSHGGRYLWIPYYRRDFDPGATSPSAVAVIDTRDDRIVRVLPTGPIPKYVEASPDNNWLAVTHWADNSIGLINISAGDPSLFAYRPDRLVVEQLLPQIGLEDKNRDRSCGYCLRGTVFSPDSETLLVARMKGGGIAGFDVESGTYLGTVLGMKPTPRHLLLSHDGSTLYVTSNISGYVSRIPLALVLESLASADGKRIDVRGWKSVHVGLGARTIDQDPSGRYLFTAVNGSSEVVVVETETMDIITRVRSDSYTVGLAVSPDGRQVWTTSQGRDGKGGNSVCVYEITYVDTNKDESEMAGRTTQPSGLNEHADTSVTLHEQNTESLSQAISTGQNTTSKTDDGSVSSILMQKGLVPAAMVR